MSRLLALEFPIFTLVALLTLSSCCDKAEAAKARRDLYSALAKDRNEAALTLAQCGEAEAGPAVPRLIELMYDQNIGVQSSAAYALRKIDTKVARDALERATKHR
jgi:HEAT repeat protein